MAFQKNVLGHVLPRLFLGPLKAAMRLVIRYLASPTANQATTLPALIPSTTTTTNMSERDLSQILGKLNGSTYAQSLALLSKAKIILLQLKALTPSPKQSSSLLSLARNVFEAGALVSIRAKDTEAFTRFVHQLTPYYELPAERYEQSSRGSSQTAQEQQNKITGLYLLLLLTQGNYSGFHTELEGLMLRAKEGEKVEEDKYLGYPIMLERWLMEGSYDLVWKAMEGGKLLPSEEYGVFSEVGIVFYYLVTRASAQSPVPNSISP